MCRMCVRDGLLRIVAPDRSVCSRGSHVYTRSGSGQSAIEKTEISSARMLIRDRVEPVPRSV